MDRQRYEPACRLPLQVLVLLEDLAALHILTYGCVHARPSMHALHTANSPVTTHMACIVGVMQLVQSCALELRDVWHEKRIAPVVQPLIYIKIGCVACRRKPGVCFVAPVDLAQQFNVSSSSSFIIFSYCVSVSDRAE